ncbi:MAG: hypothetical protein RI894_217 [Bacteroidota bacterium]|jgi:predicted ATPase
MKITNIHFDKYKQFENLRLDFTYPEGHPKAGQPLDKVCFIGQNGTGKTTILDALSDWSKWFLYKKEKEVIRGLNNNRIHFTNENKKWTAEWIETDFIDKNPLLLYLNADILSNILYLTKEKKEKQFVGTAQLDYDIKYAAFEQLEIIEIDNNTAKEQWQRFFAAFENYDTKVLDKTKALLQTATTKNGEKLLQDFIAWKSNEENPRQGLAEQLNVFLHRFGLEMDVDNTDFYIALRTLNKSLELTPNQLSTGIIQIILTSVPIFTLRNNVSTILIDEPERSLYPDTQRDIVNYYTKISRTSQFFFATHSPIIAAAFDPWEIVELYFDENNTVQQHLYYEGERHITNYRIHPKYLRWDSILIRMFGIDKEGNSERDDALVELAKIKERMDILKENNGKGTPEMQAIWQKFSDIAQKLDWRITE